MEQVPHKRQVVACACLARDNRQASSKAECCGLAERDHTRERRRALVVKQVAYDREVVECARLVGYDCQSDGVARQ